MSDLKQLSISDLWAIACYAKEVDEGYEKEIKGNIDNGTRAYIEKEMNYYTIISEEVKNEIDARLELLFPKSKLF